MADIKLNDWYSVGFREGAAGRYAPPRWIKSDRPTEAYLLGWNAGATTKAREDLKKVPAAFWEEAD